MEGDRLVARGIAGKLLEDVAPLDSAPLSDDLLKLVPEETPVLLAFQLKLPSRWSPPQLKRVLEGRRRGQDAHAPGGPGVDAARQTRRWSRSWRCCGAGRRTRTALQALFSGGARTLTRATLCKHVVLATSAQEVERLQKACEGRAPNLLNAAGPVVAGLRAPALGGVRHQHGPAAQPARDGRLLRPRRAWTARRRCPSGAAGN